MTPEKAFKTLLIRHSFYGMFLLNLNKEYSDKLETAGVCRDGIGVKLLINLNYWNTLSDDQQIALLLHECMHICFGHIFENFQRFAKFGHQLANIAEDLENNSYLDQNLVISSGWLHPVSFNWSIKKGTKWYYEELIKMANEQFKNEKNKDSDENNDNSKSGSKIPVEIFGKGKMIDDHSQWKDFEEISNAEKELIQNQIDYNLKQTAEQILRSCGKVPDELQEKIGKLFEKKPPIFDWKKYFRRLLGTQIDINLKKTYKKESIRFPDNAGIKHKKKSSILVAIDTSGSISNKDLQDFFNEIYYIWKAGAYVKVVEADTIIQREYEYTGKCPELVQGRGGTSFDECIELYNNNYRDYTTLVYFTDGYCTINKKPRNNNMIWILTSDGYDQKYPGKVIKIPK